MTAAELKHRAKQEEWAAKIGECRSSGKPVKKWCAEQNISATTYYRWERELLGIAKQPAMMAQPCVAFAEIGIPKQEIRELPERSATLRIGGGSLELYQEITPEMLRAIAEAMRLC